MNKMKKYILVISIASLLLSCSSPVDTKNFNYEGVWKRIATVKYENGVATDTFTFPEGKVRNRGIYTPGFRYKIYGSGHSIWFFSRKKVDADKNILDENYDMFGKTNYKIENDSLFETFNFWHDNANNMMERFKLGDDGYHYRAKVQSIGEDKYVQYGLRPDGSASYGELYQRVDTYNINPTDLTGAWRRVATSRIRDGKILDTVPYEAEDFSDVGSFIIAGDTKRIWAFNYKNINDEGIDVSEGSAQLSNYSLVDGKISDTLIWSNSAVRGNYERRNGLRVRDYSINDNVFSMKNINSDGNGIIVFFERE